MIVGTGMDIVEIDRIRKIYDRHADAFARRILCDAELEEYKRDRFPVRFLAKRFAAKEAVSKALGTGFSAGINPRMICVGHNEAGMPVINLFEAARERAELLSAENSWISISDEKHYAAAFVIFEKKTNQTTSD